MKSLLQKEANSAADDQAKLEREKQALQSALQKEKADRTAEVTQLKSTHASEIKNLDESRKQVRNQIRNLTCYSYIQHGSDDNRNWIAPRRSCVMQLIVERSL